MSDYFDISAGSPDTVYSLGDSQTTYSLNSSGSGNGVSITGIGVPWTTTGVSNNGYALDPNWVNGISSKIQLDGPEADIEINGESLIGMLRNIEQRLNILKPNPELESQWTELKALGDAYRKLEAEIQAKMKTWNAIAK
jgi:hypothetical protein